jgi:PhoH-like ATPase
VADLLARPFVPATTEEVSGRSSTAEVVILDTSALVSDPEAIFAFSGADAVIPLTVVEELDSLKTRRDDVGRSAREVIRTIEDLRTANGGDIRHAVALPGGGTVRIETNGLHLDEVSARGFDPAKPDNRILAAALGQASKNPDAVVSVVSNDAALRIKAAQLGLEAREHHRGRVLPAGQRPAGWRTIEVMSSVIDDLYATDTCHLDALHVDGELGPNEYAVLRAGQQSILVRSRDGVVESLQRGQEAWGVRPRAKEQQFALDLLLDPEVRIVALDGYAGTGKTILALAAGLEQVMERPTYDKVAVYRPVVPVGKSELGFLPGTLAEKLDPWMMAVTDALVAMTEHRSHRDAMTLLEEMTTREKLSMETVTYLRGRSLLGTYVLVDEAQNLEPTTLKTILTRVGEGTKVVFTGDTSQIDAPYLSEHTNAIAALIDAFDGERLFGHIRLTHCERSEVASLAAERL